MSDPRRIPPIDERTRKLWRLWSILTLLRLVLPLLLGLVVFVLLVAIWLSVA